MIRKSQNGITWLEFNLLQNYPITHGILMRHGGVSPAPYSSLNFGRLCGDTEENVSQNFKLLQSTFSLPKIFSGSQVHGNHIAHITNTSPTSTDSCDGLVTSEKNAALLIKHADCQAALFYDPKKHIIAAVHSGWRGSVLNIYAETVKKMTLLGSEPQDIIVCISPSLGPENSQFLNYEKELPEEFHPFQFKPYYFDFWSISKKQLQDLGILPKNIEFAEICTYDGTGDFFSYRKEKMTGRNASFIMLHPNHL